MSISSRTIIQFNAVQAAAAIHVTSDESPTRALAALELPAYRGVIVVHGGAGNMEEKLLDTVRQFLIAGLAPLAEEQRLLVVDGGTQSGVGQLLGEARQHIKGTFPLLGVVPSRYVTYPGSPTPDDEPIPLNAAHTHFILVDHGEFGIESALLVGLLQNQGKPGAALIINGGEIVLKEALAHAGQNHIVITVQGSGRIADRLADPTSPESKELPTHARLHVADVRAPLGFRALLKRLLFTPTS